MSHFCPNAQHKQRYEGSTSTKKRQANKSHFCILAYNVFPLKNKKINKTECAPAQEHFANEVSDMLRTQVINTLKLRVQYWKNVFSQLNSIYWCIMPQDYLPRLFMPHDYLAKGVGIVTECINDNDSNKRNNYRDD